MDQKVLINIVLIVILIINLIIFSKYNKLIKLKNRVTKSKSNIEIYLNKRFDLIPNIVETVKGYTKHESTTLENITALRENYKEQKNMNIKKAEEMNNELTKYLLKVENYPELKANENFLELQNELRNIENELQKSRHIYNDEVTRYNTAIETVPSNLIASIFAFKKASLFEIEENKKENIKVEL